MSAIKRFVLLVRCLLKNLDGGGIYVLLLGDAASALVADGFRLGFGWE
jgi:hypothetical protein